MDNGDYDFIIIGSGAGGGTFQRMGVEAFGKRMMAAIG
jgi:hypothetical protein